MNRLVMKILRGKFVPTPLHYSGELREVIAKLLSKAPGQRPTIDQLLDMTWVRETVAKFSNKVVQVKGPSHDDISLYVNLQYAP
jgi:hypothetical protein